MVRGVPLLGLFPALLAVAGCSPNAAGTAGVTYKEVESGATVAPDSATLASVAVEGGDAVEGDPTPEVVVDPVTDSAVSQASASGEPLTLEQELQIAAIQVQPGYEEGEKLFFVVDGALRIGFDDLDLVKVLNMTYIPTDATKYFPDWMMDLDGKRVRLRGFMYDTYDGTTRFLLCRDLGLCCFGPNPRPDYRIPVTLREGETTNWIYRVPFDVVGTFHINLTIDDLGKVSHTYAISEATIIRL